MCDTGNLIDLTGWDEPVKDETTVVETHSESIIIESTSFKGPYDPFDSMEKEACIKGLNSKDQAKETDNVTDSPFEYADQDLNNETPPIAMDYADAGVKMSPVCGDSQPQQTSLQKQVVQLNAMRMSSIGTPPSRFSANFSRNAKLTENLQMIAAESPIKLIEDDHNPLESPALVSTPPTASNLSDDTCSNTEFQERLKLLRIAMLDTQSKKQEVHESNTAKESPTATTTKATNVAELGKLLQNMQSLICEHVEESKRKQFDNLIESISAAVQNIAVSPDAQYLSPHAHYKRQGTFDLDLEQQKQKSLESPEDVIGKPMQEFPDAMTCSSATFDGESLATDKAALPIPIIESPPTAAAPDSYVTELVNDNLALQINELLERHNLTKLQQHNDQMQHETDHNETKSVGGATVILVVNSNAGNQLPSCVVHPTATRTTQASASNRASTVRRRSSSLSIHDKSKAEQPRTLVKQSSGDNSSTTNTSQCVPLKELSVVGDKFNAMSSYRQRRNSFSVGLTANKQGVGPTRALLCGRNKTATINETNIVYKPKDVIPVKRVAPMVKPSMDSKHLNSTVSRCSVGPETPMPSRSKAATKLFCTSTPMPQMRRSLKPMSSFAGSTPNVRSTGYGKKAAQ